MLINVSEGEECRIALLEDGKLEELYIERTSSTSHVGNIYKGKVTNVEPSIQAAFIDFGLGRNGFLHISDLMPQYFGRKGEDIVETVGKKMARRDRPPIQRCLRRGDEIIVQIIKEGIGTKGPTLSTYLSIPGRILVMMPGMGKMGVSRKIEDDPERRRLRQILDSLKPPKDVGFIIRTAGVGKSKTEIERDLKYLTRLWEQLEKKRTSGSGPMELYTEGDLVTRTVRDVFSGEVDQIVIDNEEVAKRVMDVIKISAPRTKNRVELYTDPIPLFSKFGIERDIEMMYSRHVPLPSGGGLVIDSTEAIVAIDVNSGKFREHADAETTAFKTDMEAADEIVRQLRLRDLGGVIICDFIDLRYERHRRALEDRLNDLLKDDRAKTKVLSMSQFGIIEMTRQRMRPSLKRSVYFDCPHCKGAGLVKTPESMSLDVMRRLAIAVSDSRVERVELAVCAEAAFHLQNRKRRTLAELEDRNNKTIVITSDPKLGLDEMRMELLDNREGLVMLPELAGVLTQPAHTSQLNTRSARGATAAAPRGREPMRGRPQPAGGRPPAAGGRTTQPARAGWGDDESGGFEDRIAVDEEEEALPTADREPDSTDEIAPADDRDRDRGGRGRGDQNNGARHRNDRDRGVANREFPSRDQGRRDQGNRNQGNRDQGNRDQGNREQGNRDQGTRDQGNRDPVNRNGGNRDQANRGQGNRDGASRDFGNRGRDDRAPARGQRGDGRNSGDRDPQRGRPLPNNPRRPMEPRNENFDARDQRNGPAFPRTAAGFEEESIDGEPNEGTLSETGAPTGDHDSAGPMAPHGGGQGADGEGDEGPRRRRRRRRGRRGRGRGREDASNETGINAEGAGPDEPQDLERGPEEFDGENNEGYPAPQGSDHDDHEEDREDSRELAGAEGRAPDQERPPLEVAAFDRDEISADAEREAFADREPALFPEEPAPQTAEPTPAEAVEQAPASERVARGRQRKSDSADAAEKPKGRSRAKTKKAAPATSADEAVTPAAEKPARGSRSRGGRGRKKAAPVAEEGAEVADPAEDQPEPSPRGRSGRAASARPPTPERKPPTPIVIPKTGSTDRHLVDDEPVTHEPVRRPRSYRDLDQIPDDFDD